MTPSAHIFSHSSNNAHFYYFQMIHTIARYYNTTERMTNLFAKITDQMIANCKQCIADGRDKDQLWEKNPEDLVRQLESCL